MCAKTELILEHNNVTDVWGSIFNSKVIPTDLVRVAAKSRSQRHHIASLKRSLMICNL